MLPSIPARPRFAYVVTPLRGVAKPSMSLIGRDEAINTAESFGIAAEITAAIWASFQPSFSLITLAQRVENLFHCAIQSCDAGCASR
ncbi:unannotated protein [freshwater metagenome]|uniref:Unannotated protein n=1 Tax=freshwater metagenome TaxID=449393 RepID=A0A6J7VDG3_9ZZZZ